MYHMPRATVHTAREQLHTTVLHAAKCCCDVNNVMLSDRSNDIPATQLPDHRSVPHMYCQASVQANGSRQSARVEHLNGVANVQKTWAGSERPMAQ